MDLKKLIKEVLATRKPDCRCGCNNGCAKAPILNENLQSRILMTENMQYHIDNKKPLTENTFRYGSKAFLDLWAEARYLYSRNALDVSGIDKEIIVETKLGEYGLFEGQVVPLDMPILEEGEVNEDKYNFNINKVWDFIESRPFNNPNYMPKFNIAKEIWDEWGDKEKQLYNDFQWEDKYNGQLHPKEIANLQRRKNYDSLAGINEAEYQGKKVQIGKPKRGGASGKKFYVYVMDKGKVKKVSFGDSGGLSTKINDPKARQAFAKRHNCAQKTDRTTAGYWSCRIGRYWKSLGGSKNFSGYW
jgi:hypothetical protein